MATTAPAVQPPAAQPPANLAPAPQTQPKQQQQTSQTNMKATPTFWDKLTKALILIILLGIIVAGAPWVFGKFGVTLPWGNSTATAETETTKKPGSDAASPDGGSSITVDAAYKVPDNARNVSAKHVGIKRVGGRESIRFIPVDSEYSVAAVFHDEWMPARLPAELPGVVPSAEPLLQKLQADFPELKTWKTAETLNVKIKFGTRTHRNVVLLKTSEVPPALVVPSFSAGAPGSAGAPAPESAPAP